MELPRACDPHHAALCLCLARASRGRENAFGGKSVCLPGTVSWLVSWRLPLPGWSLKDWHGSTRPTRECQSGCSGPDVFRKQGLTSPELFLESHFKLKLLISVHSPSLAKLASQGLLPIKKKQPHFLTLTIWFHQANVRGLCNSIHCVWLTPSTARKMRFKCSGMSFLPPSTPMLPLGAAGLLIHCSKAVP